MQQLRNNLMKAEKEEIYKMATIIRNTRYPNGYISPHVAAQRLYEAGYRKSECSGAGKKP